MKERIIDRIKKLVALSKDNPSKEEAMAAALKAQRLMVEHDITERDIFGSKPEKVVELTTDTSFAGAANVIGSVASAIASGFRCKCWVHTGFDHKHRVVFMGRESDAEVCRITFEYLWSAAHKGGLKAKRDFKERWGYVRQGEYNNFVYGFAAGIRSEMEKQSRELMVVVPKDVEDRFAEKSFHRCRTGQRGSTTSYNSGVIAGRSAVQARRMGGNLALTA